jgi:hypothetical protein
MAGELPILIGPIEPHPLDDGIERHEGGPQGRRAGLTVTSPRADNIDPDRAARAIIGDLWRATYI